MLSVAQHNLLLDMYAHPMAAYRPRGAQMVTMRALHRRGYASLSYPEPAWYLLTTLGRQVAHYLRVASLPVSNSIKERIFDDTTETSRVVTVDGERIRPEDVVLVPDEEEI